MKTMLTIGLLLYVYKYYINNYGKSKDYLEGGGGGGGPPDMLFPPPSENWHYIYICIYISH